MDLSFLCVTKQPLKFQDVTKPSFRQVFIYFVGPYVTGKSRDAISTNQEFHNWRFYHYVNFHSFPPPFFVSSHSQVKVTFIPLTQPFKLLRLLEASFLFLLARTRCSSAFSIWQCLCEHLYETGRNSQCSDILRSDSSLIKDCNREGVTFIAIHL